VLIDTYFSHPMIGNKDQRADPPGRKAEMTLENRVEVLEKELKKTKRHNRYLLGFVLTALTIGAVSSAFSTSAKEVRANQFIVEDESGKPRVVLSAGENGPSLSLTDENGKVRFALNVRKNGPGLGLLDENGKTRAILSADAQGTALCLKDENGKLRVALNVSGDQEGLLLRDENGKPVGSLP
jgi:hypothetical protein